MSRYDNGNLKFGIGALLVFIGIVVIVVTIKLVF